MQLRLQLIKLSEWYSIAVVALCTSALISSISPNPNPYVTRRPSSIVSAFTSSSVPNQVPATNNASLICQSIAFPVCNAIHLRFQNSLPLTIIMIIPTFTFMSRSSKKMCASKTMHNKQEDVLAGISRTCCVIGSDDEDDEPYEYTIQCAKECLALRKRQGEIVTEEVKGEENSCITYHDSNPAIEVTHLVSSCARELRPSQRVRFIDEVFGMATPRHVVTDTHYRPVTKEEDKTLLYYSSEDYAQFAIEDWREKLSNDIKRMEELQEDTKNTISRVRRQHNLCAP